MWTIGTLLVARHQEWSLEADQTDRRLFFQHDVRLSSPKPRSLDARSAHSAPHLLVLPQAGVVQHSEGLTHHAPRRWPRGGPCGAYHLVPKIAMAHTLNPHRPLSPPPPPFYLQAAAVVHAAVPSPSTVQWALNYGDLTGNGQSGAAAIAVDPATGVSYIGGYCKGTLPVGTQTLTCAGGVCKRHASRPPQL